MTMNSMKPLFEMRTLARIVSAVCALLFFGTAAAQRERHTLNDGWRFCRGDVPGAEAPSFDDGRWRPVHLPHTWNADAYTDKEYYRGKGWYRRTLRLPGAWRGRRILLRTEAASKAATLYVNGREAGSHAGGYTAFDIDLTPFLDPDSVNTLAFCVDNAREDIPPVSGDFTFFGGIYRDVWLTALPECRFEGDAFGSNGLFVSTPEVSDERGTIAVRLGVKNDAPVRRRVEIVCSIVAPDGGEVQTLRRRVELPAGGSVPVAFASAPIGRPELWTPETPRLYRVETELRDVRSGGLLDRLSCATAFRWFRFDGREGFFLNGRPYKLRGVCRHQDQKPVGAALTDEMHRRDFQLMKEMGANFIRVSHYPQDEALLEMCDREGMLVWEEIPVIDIVPDTPGYADNCERSLREMIRQHYNHPSIVMWGYMNEILLVAQRRYRSPGELNPAVERTLALARRLERALDGEDSTRVSTMAFHGSNIYNETGLSGITDVVGWNLYSGWYGGDLAGFERYLAEQQRDWPGHPVIVSEYGAGSDRRLHSGEPQPFDFSIEYQQRYIEHYLPVLERTPYVCGGAYWNFIDFSSALRDESMPRINNKGLVCADRTPKDVYYYFKAAWRREVPVLHIAGRDRPLRCGVAADGEPVVQPVKVYTNLPEVELLVDGCSLGRRPVENFHALFDVPFRDGDHLLSARGTFRGEEVRDAVGIGFRSYPARFGAHSAEGVELAVNVGSRCSYTSGESGLTWLPDRPYEPGGWGWIGGRERSVQTEIAATADGPLFQTVREGIEGYRFDLPQGDYEVELLFADVDRPVETAAYLLGREAAGAEEGGSRFEIRINGRTVEEDFSPARDNGPFRAVRRRYEVRNEADSVEIRLNPRQGKCFLSGVKLRKL